MCNCVASNIIKLTNLSFCSFTIKEVLAIVTLAIDSTAHLYSTELYNLQAKDMLLRNRLKCCQYSWNYTLHTHCI